MTNMETVLFKLMEEEGCAGCAESFAIACNDGDDAKARAVVMTAAEHIREFGYQDGWADVVVSDLTTWAIRHGSAVILKSQGE